MSDCLLWHALLYDLSLECRVPSVSANCLAPVVVAGSGAPSVFLGPMQTGGSKRNTSVITWGHRKDCSAEGSQTVLLHSRFASVYVFKSLLRWTRGENTGVKPGLSCHLELVDMVACKCISTPSRSDRHKWKMSAETYCVAQLLRLLCYDIL